VPILLLMSIPRLVIFDIDGTALPKHPHRKASRRLRSAVTALVEHGVRVTAATGRSTSSLFSEPAIMYLGLSDPVIVAGGAMIVDPLSRSVIHQVDISPEALATLTTLLDPYSLACWLWNDYPEKVFLTGGNPKPDLNSEPIYFLNLTSVPQKLYDKLVGPLSQIPDIQFISSPAITQGHLELHLTGALATKRHAVHVLQERFALDASQTVVIGDGHNDIELFEAGGLRVAMGNAIPELKAQADLIIGDVHEDGLAFYLESLL
jgi:hydroxymethylpyrimidine pyrophosphatase-like HAD family hydrolase